MRSRWLARKLWLVTAADVALLGRRHWKRLEPDERDRLAKLIIRWPGQGSRLTPSERREMSELLDKLGHVELLSGAARRAVPFGGGIAGRVLGRAAGGGKPKRSGRSAEIGQNGKPDAAKSSSRQRA